MEIIPSRQAIEDWWHGLRHPGASYGPHEPGGTAPAPGTQIQTPDGGTTTMPGVAPVTPPQFRNHLEELQSQSADIQNHIVQLQAALRNPGPEGGPELQARLDAYMAQMVAINLAMKAEQEKTTAATQALKPSSPQPGHH